jgi:signal transduction histidine kinase
VITGTGKDATVKTMWRFDPPKAFAVIVAAIVAAAAAAFSLRWPDHVVDAGARAGIETIIAMSALLTSVLLLLQYRRHRQMSDLLLLSALVAIALTDFVFSALPDLLGVSDVPFAFDARLVSQMLVPIAFTAAAFAHGQRTVGERRWRVVLIGAACVGAIALAEVLDLIAGRGTGSGSAGSTAARWVNVGSAAVFVLAGIAFAWRSRPASIRVCLLAGASFLLAAVRFQYVAIPVVAADWVTLRELLRLAAYGLLLAAVAREYAQMRRADEQAAVSAERERIARDLHDGLAQDLAVIAVHAQQLESGLGAEHPLAVAARRAIAASRETIVDLSASTAPSTFAALREVAEELTARYDIDITVREDIDGASGAADLGSRAREQIVRIAREAIVNAARHGLARHVEVVLQGRGARWLLKVSDDGSGIEQSAFNSAAGFGLRTMRARAEALGGQLIARRRASGGTDLEVSLAAPPPQ